MEKSTLGLSMPKIWHLKWYDFSQDIIDHFELNHDFRPLGIYMTKMMLSVGCIMIHLI